jgi:hypothetical protein
MEPHGRKKTAVLVDLCCLKIAKYTINVTSIRYIPEELWTRINQYVMPESLFILDNIIGMSEAFAKIFLAFLPKKDLEKRHKNLSR